VVDAHVDVLWAMEKEGRTLGERSARGHTDLPRLQEAGMRLVFFSAFLPPEYKPERALAQQLRIVDRFWQEAAAHAGHMRVVRTRQDLAALDEDPRLGALLSLEGAEAVLDPAILRVFFQLGVRCIALTWNERNHLADGVGVGEGGGGLTPMGLAVLQEMERLGVLLDVSHLHPRGFWHVVEASRRPFIASHSDCRRVHDHPRNLDDDQIRALARAQGVMGLNFFPGFLTDGPATVQDVLRHADHVLELVGDDHLGLGSDFDGIESTPAGLEDVTRLPDLAEAMLAHGYPESTVRKILGENLRRVLQNVLPDGDAAVVKAGSGS
jgi:membrane dipeptidase